MTKDNYVPRRDAVRRETQADRIIRIISAHQLFLKYGLDKDGSIGKIAADLGVSERTVHRDKLVLKRVYEKLGRQTLE